MSFENIGVASVPFPDWSVGKPKKRKSERQSISWQSDFPTAKVPGIKMSKLYDKGLYPEISPKMLKDPNLIKGITKSVPGLNPIPDDGSGRYKVVDRRGPTGDIPKPRRRRKSTTTKRRKRKSDRSKAVY